MDGPQIRTNGEDESEGVGYEMTESDIAAKDALKRLLDYLRRLRRTGAETRGWTRQTLETLDEKLYALNHLTQGESSKALVADLVAWEGHILQVIRHYMQEVSDTINRIKTLNPPLTANHLRPFIQAVENDRTETIEALGPLADAIEKLAIYRRTNPRSQSAA